MGSIPDGSSKPWSKAQANKLSFSLIPGSWGKNGPF